MQALFVFVFKLLKILIVISVLLVPKISCSQSNNDSINTVLLDSLEYGLSDSLYSFNNSNIKIIPPRYFVTLPNDVMGFIHNSSASSIQISEIKNTAYFMVTKGLDSVYFENQKLKLVSKNDVVTNDGKKGTYFLIKFKVQEIEFERIMFFTGDYNRTIWINANYPALGHDTLFNVLLSSILTVKF